MVKLLPKRFHLETFVCAIKGHVAPAQLAATVTIDDAHLVFERDGIRHARCLRCDAWLATDIASMATTYEGVLTLTGDAMPRRGPELKDAVVLRCISVSRGLHAVFFASAALVLFALDRRLPGLQRQAARIQDALHLGGGTQGQLATRDSLARNLNRLLGLHKSSLHTLMYTSIGYAAIEGVEAVGLWREQRWAEYLTAVALVGFLPFELIELSKKISVIRVGALVINLAMLAYLVWNKRLFGVNRAQTVE